MNQGFVEFIFPYFTYLCTALGTPLYHVYILDFNNDTCNVLSHSSSTFIGQFKRRPLESCEKRCHKVVKKTSKTLSIGNGTKRSTKSVAIDIADEPNVIVVQFFGVIHLR